jgi:hypothetical protein
MKGREETNEGREQKRSARVEKGRKYVRGMGPTEKRVLRTQVSLYHTPHGGQSGKNPSPNRALSNHVSRRKKACFRLIRSHSARCES